PPCGDVELAVHAELELARARACADEAAAVVVAHLEPDGELGYDRVQHQTELPVDEIDERRTRPRVSGGGGEPAVALGLVAVPERDPDGRGEAFPERVGREERSVELERMLPARLLGPARRVAALAAAEPAGVAHAHPVPEPDRELERDGLLLEIGRASCRERVERPAVTGCW